MAHLIQSVFGEVAPIGTLYDARSGRFRAASIIPGELLPLDSVSENSCSKTETVHSHSGTFAERFKALGIKEDMAAGILAGLVRPQGAAAYLRDSLGTSEALHGAVYHKVLTMKQMLNIADAVSKGHIDLTPLRAQECTHVVTAIDWGLRSILASKTCLTDNVERSVAEDAFGRDLNLMRTAIESFGLEDERNVLEVEQMELQHDLTLYSDVLVDEGLVMRGLSEVRDFVRLIPAHLSQGNGGKGWPVSYTLLPLGMLQYFISGGFEIDVSFAPIGPDHLTKFVHLFEEFAVYEDSLRSYSTYLEGHRLHVDEDHRHAVAASIDHLAGSKRQVQAELSRVLVEVRSGMLNPSSLGELYEHATSADQPLGKVPSICGQESEKLDFLTMAISNGALYLGHNGLSFSTPRKETSCYIFLLSNTAMRQESLWDENQALLFDLLTDTTDIPVYVADCDAASLGIQVEEPRIAKYERGREVVSDLLQHTKFLAGKCFVRHKQEAMDSSQQPKPVRRRRVKIPCPGKECDVKQVCEWTCSSCLAPVEWGFSDEFIYCDCGRAVPSAYDFKCNGANHGAEYDAYDAKILQGLLSGLDQSDYLNILILGETGVGKSTFINAFVNYLSYSTLDEAKAAAAALECVIPCSFSVQMMDRDDSSQEIEEKHIRIGSRDDEVDGAKGDSATQKTAVYPVAIGPVTYRLIDTPGIGDTRGVSFDKKNMADLLQTLNSYDTLHGILILLKSNNARLNATFRFCIKELLTHLHRSAVENMAFGFTNTRISNYTPGDTFGPLKALLREHSDIGLPLSMSTTYCFDSESFRYLAAYRNGINVPNEEEFRRSWDHSRREANRLLSHFKSRTPHAVTNTLSLNGARRLISELTKPMAEISKLIRDNITLFEDQRQQLQDSRLTADNLRKRLQIEKIQFEAKQLQRPRTVCKMAACCDFKDSGKGNGEVVTIYKTHCHPVCYLTDVKQDTLADPGLIMCAAMAGTDTCTVCGHRWQEHLHVLYELEEVKVQVNDTEIERRLRANADDVKLRQAGFNDLTRLIVEFQMEHKEIQRAAAEFGFFLKENAITPVNDATLDYISMLIRNEEDKIHAGQQANMSVELNEKRLRSLEDDKKAHIELVNTLSQNAHNPEGGKLQVLDEKGVDDLVQRLYRLKHFGKNLESIKNVVASAHQATNRERPHRVRERGLGGSGRSSGHGDDRSSLLQRYSARRQGAGAAPSRNATSQPPRGSRWLRYGRSGWTGLISSFR